MYIKYKRKKIEIRELTKFWERFRGLKFVLEPLDYGVKFPKKHFISTNFLCQKVDVVITDKEETILYIIPSLRSEKYIFPKRRGTNIYFLPDGVASCLTIGETMPLCFEKEEAMDHTKKKKRK